MLVHFSCAKQLKNIPFDELSFGVITYEHDYYCDQSKSYRRKARKILNKAGYILVAANISPDKNSPYEDWWVHPQNVDNVNIDVNKRVLHATDYLLKPSSFNWGPCTTNTKFKKVEEGDVVVDFGSNVGLWSYDIMDRKPKHIYAIEPELECFLTTELNLKSFPNITVINKAIAEETGHKVIKGLFNKNSMV